MTSTSPGPATDISRAAVLVVSPITAKLRRPRVPTLPTTACPVLTPTRNAGQSGWRGEHGAAGVDDRERGAGGPVRVVGLVAPDVEDRHHRVAGELLDLAARRVDHRARPPPSTR